MRRLLSAGAALVLLGAGTAAAQDGSGSGGSGSGGSSNGSSNGGGGAETVPGAVRVTVVKMGGDYSVQSVRGGGSDAQTGCVWSVDLAPDLGDVPYGTSPGPQPDPEARFALLLCNGTVVRAIWLAPSDIIDLDAAARDAAQRYIEDVLAPAITVGINPSATGLVGLPSWFWVEGFSGEVTAPPIDAFGFSIEVRMSSHEATWDFGDGTVVTGDLGRAYPAESTVRHAHQHDGTFTVAARIQLVPEYRVNGGPWITLPPLETVATADNVVEERQAVITDV